MPIERRVPMPKVLLVLFLSLTFACEARASIDVYEFSSDEYRERYQQFLEELRCPKCKNNNLAGTNSKIAVDLRRQLHTMLEQGQSDEEIIDFMVMSYGDFVLYRPRVQPSTLALWLAPGVFLGLGGLIIGGIILRRRKALASEKVGLSEAEQHALERLLKKGDQASSSTDSNS